VIHRFLTGPPGNDGKDPVAPFGKLPTDEARGFPKPAAFAPREDLDANQTDPHLELSVLLPSHNLVIASVLW
jgi:hypothetical protein